MPPGLATDTVLEQTIKVFRKWLHMPDPSPLLATAGCIAANRIAGDPVWLLVVGPPGGGKSELIQSFTGLPHIHPASTLTEASLLSGTPKRELTDDSKGGLLRTIGDFGILVLKDFTSVLSMQRDERAKTLSALREVYDGAWTRHVGADGGRTLHWEGRIGMLAGVTPTIDRHHSVMAAMGERFIFFRLPQLDAAAIGKRSIAHAGHETLMRMELQEASHALLADSLPTPREISDEEVNRLISLARLVVRGRSAVERDSYSREIELITEPEVPTRITVALKRMLGGIEAIGCDSETAWSVVVKIALDSMPQLRRQLLEKLEPDADGIETAVIAEMLQYPTTTARRGLEDLQVYGLVEKVSQGKGKADIWLLSDFSRDRLEEIGGLKMAYECSRFVSPSGEGDKSKDISSSIQNGNGSEVNGMAPLPMAEDDILW